jgi:hypothetical protein
VLDAAGNRSLVTTELKVTIAEHAAGNFRVMMNIAEELFVGDLEREVTRLDEKLYHVSVARSGLICRVPRRARSAGAEDRASNGAHYLPSRRAISFGRYTDRREVHWLQFPPELRSVAGALRSSLQNQLARNSRAAPTAMHNSGG